MDAVHNQGVCQCMGLLRHLQAKANLNKDADSCCGKGVGEMRLTI